MKNIRKIQILVLLPLCIFIVSCNNNKPEFYKLPYVIYPAGKVRSAKIDSVRIDCIGVKNFNENNPSHLKEAQRFIVENICPNYTKYADYSIIFLKYRKRVASFIAMYEKLDYKNLSRWQHLFILRYRWWDGEFCERISYSKADEYYRKKKKLKKKTIPLTWAKLWITPKPLVSPQPLSNNTGMEFYPLYPPCFQHGIFAKGKLKRIDYFAVKNFKPNNPSHLKEMDIFISKNIAKNYADYHAYQIRILKYKEEMRKICESGNINNDYYAVWHNKHTQLIYMWKDGVFITQLDKREYEHRYQYIDDPDMYMYDSESYTNTYINGGRYPFNRKEDLK